MSRLSSHDNSQADLHRRSDLPGNRIFGRQYAFGHDKDFATAHEERGQPRTVRDSEVAFSRKRFTDGLGLFEHDILVEGVDDDDSTDDFTDDGPHTASPMGRDGRQLVSYTHLGIETFGSASAKQQQDLNMTHAVSSLVGGSSRLHVLESTSISEVPGESPVKLIYDLSPESSASYLYRWFHYHEKRLCMSQFRKLAFSNQYMTSENAKIIDAVLDRAQKELEREYVHGKYMAAGVVRCNGHIYRSKPVATSATFISMPHFKMAELDSNTKGMRADALEHPIRTLLQSAYRTHSTADRDSDQFLSVEDKSKHGQTIHAPNLWLLLVGEDYIVTYGYVNFDTVKSSNIDLSDHRSVASADLTREGNARAQSNLKTIDVTSLKESLSASNAIRLEAGSLEPVDFEGRKYLWRSKVADSASHVGRDRLESPHTIRPFLTYTNHAKHRDASWTSNVNLGVAGDEVLHHNLNRAASCITDVLSQNAIKDLPLLDAVENAMELFDKRLELERLDYDFLWTSIRSTHGAREAFLRAYPSYQRFLSRNSPENSSQGKGGQTLSGESTEMQNGEGKLQKEGEDSEDPQTENTETRERHSANQMRHHQTTDYYASHLRQHITQQVDMCNNAVDEICEAFVPTKFSHSLLHKIWGCMSVLAMLCNESAKSGNRTAANELSAGWIMRTDAVLGLNEKMFDFLPKPKNPWRLCEACVSGCIYSSQEDAREHLNTVHFPNTLSKTLKPGLAFWIISPEQALEHRRLHQYIFLLEIVIDCMEKMLLRVRLIRRTLGTKLGGRGRYVEGEHLPVSLTQAFEDLVIFLLTTSLVFSSTKLKSMRWTDLDHAVGDRAAIQSYGRIIARNGVRAGNAFENATNQVILLLLDPKTSGKTETSVAIGTNELAHVILANILRAPLWDGESLVEMYKNLISSQFYHVYNKTPQRRRLEEIQALQEEISIVLAKYDEQQRALRDFFDVLRPMRSEKTSGKRVLRIEKLNCQISDQVSQDEENLRQLAEILKDLELKARYRIEVLEEDNSKTIFVFTVVTAVFLPLSFVTSFLGMNTKDIRSLESTQTLFWEMGIPVTAVVLILVVIWAHNSDKLANLWLWLLPGKQRRRREHLRVSTSTSKKAEPEKMSILSTMWAKELSRAKQRSMSATDKV